MQQVVSKSRLTVDEVAETLGIEARDVLRLIARGRLSPVIVGGNFEVRVIELESAANAGRLASDLKRPDLDDANHGVERKVRQRLTESLGDVLTPAVVKAEMVRVAKPGQNPWSVPTVYFSMSSPPLEFLQALGQPADSGEYRPRISGESPKPVGILITEYVKGRARKALKDLLDVNDGPDAIYTSPAKFNEMMSKVIAKLEKETITARKNVLVEFDTQVLQVGRERQTITTRCPVDVVVSVRLADAALGMLNRVPDFF